MAGSSRRGRRIALMTALDPVSQVRMQLGRNLTYGMLDSLGRSIVIGRYDSPPSQPRPNWRSSTA
jgi:hypothetical protein